VAALSDLDLARTAVFVDFDGTISVADVGRHLLARFADPSWWDLHLRFDAGEIGSRECLAEQWALMRGEESEMRRAGRDVALDPGFRRLVTDLRAGGAEVTVVSDGFGFYVHDACADVEVGVVTNAVDFATGELRFPYDHGDCACSACGVCKPAPLRAAGARGLTTVLIGDGTSDRKAALVADVVFAKDPLAQWCVEQGVTHHPFEVLDDVRCELLAASADTAV
jgi:2,3-diketo-5-methylthio-1-phosphopentane phosphatase